MIHGSCLCGQVSFELENRFSQFHLCHCSQCQKATGSAHASNLFTSPDNIHWLTGSDFVSRYDVPGRTISNAFCRHCGSALPYVSGSGKALVVPAGCLDDTPAITPEDNIFWAEKAPWYEAALASPHFAGFPE
ncbi:GFA family protein [Gallaecimonas mangrovi]|uniref:GFA family protein n=1 Tax=Gallaecimonas mangrovi TaxID=2291597 RepID=UPI000E208E0C|nr:GFA family protein [Gallaecimonas mangrovi]